MSNASAAGIGVCRHGNLASCKECQKASYSVISDEDLAMLLRNKFNEIVNIANELSTRHWKCEVEDIFPHTFGKYFNLARIGNLTIKKVVEL